MNPLIPLFVMIPLAGAFLIMITGRFAVWFGRYLTTLILTVLAAFSIFSLAVTGENTAVYKVGGWEPLNGIPIGIHMVMDGFSVIVLCIINIVGVLAALYSIPYIKRYTSENYYYSLFCLMIGGMNGVVLSGDIFNIFVFLEVSAISSYALVAFGVEKNELEASFKYQVLGALASFLILLGIALIYWKTKTLNIADIREVFSTGYDRTYYLFVQILLLGGFGLKAAMIPFHAWLPDAHSSAPSPISAMLSGVFKSCGDLCDHQAVLQHVHCYRKYFHPDNCNGYAFNGCWGVPCNRSMGYQATAGLSQHKPDGICDTFNRNRNDTHRAGEKS